MDPHRLSVLAIQVQSVGAEHHVDCTDHPAIHELQHPDLPYASVAGSGFGLIGWQSDKRVWVYLQMLWLTLSRCFAYGSRRRQFSVGIPPSYFANRNGASSRSIECPLTDGSRDEGQPVASLADTPASDQDWYAYLLPSARVSHPVAAYVLGERSRPSWLICPPSLPSEKSE